MGRDDLENASVARFFSICDRRNGETTRRGIVRGDWFVRRAGFLRIRVCAAFCFPCEWKCRVKGEAGKLKRGGVCGACGKKECCPEDLEERGD